MSHDWSHDVKKFVPEADAVAIKGIVKRRDIALQSRDSSFVACQDKAERDRVRFLKRKLGLAAPDAEPDPAIMDICQKMKADQDKSRGPSAICSPRGSAARRLSLMPKPAATTPGRCLWAVPHEGRALPRDLPRALFGSRLRAG
jgi:hypothetical protein